MSHLPISVIIPTLNRPELCLNALRSVYAQSQRPAQVIVVDDGSTEDLSIVRSFLIECGGVYLRQDNQGVAAARNHGVTCATQPWIAFLDSDDSWLPLKLEKQFRLHLTDPMLMLSQTAEVWMRSGAEIQQKKFQAPAQGECFERALELCCISASAVLIRRDIFLDHGGFDTSFPVCEDYDLWLRLTRLYQVGLVQDALVVKNRGRSDQLSESVEAPDRFRVRAIDKILGLDLTAGQRVLAQRSLLKRLTYLEQGARKRGLSQDLEHYRVLRERWS